MNIQQMWPLQKLCLAISEIKEQVVDELPHYGHQALFFKMMQSQLD